MLQMMFLGPHRFGDFTEQLGLSEPVLSQRLSDLLDSDLIEQHQYSQRPPRYEYGLAESGQGLWKVFVAMWSWEARWATADEGSVPRLVHDTCGQSIRPLFGCGACGAVGVDHRQTSARRRPGSSFTESNPPRRYRRSTVGPAEQGHMLGGAAINLLGDRWSVSVLGAGLLGINRFGEIQSELGISPGLLQDRLESFVADDVITRRPIADGQRRMDYRLRPKGLDMLPVFATVNAWANKWMAGTDASDLAISHTVCTEILDPIWVCPACSQPLELGQFHFEP